MKAMKKTIAVILALIMISASFVCFAADGEKQYHKYDKVMLLGDSQNSGFRDYEYVMTEFVRIEESYAAYVADTLGAQLLPYACPGFRTIELRCMLDDNYKPEDKYLFAEVPHTPADEIMAKSGEMRQAIKDADMIMIGIGGNDWGAYLGWVAEDIQNANNLPEEYKVALDKFLKDATLEDDVVAQIIDLANKFNALDDLIAVLPGAIEYAFSNLRTNWEYIVEYIYENNPDVTLVVVGMFPTYFSTQPGDPDNVATPNDAEKLVEDAIIDVGNLHMIEGQAKYGYIYVDTYGTIVEESHPTVEGQKFLAKRILEELPDALFPYSEDVLLRNPNFKAIEYVVMNGIMTGTSETTFSPDAPLTQDAFSKALNKITGDYEVSEKTSKVSKLSFAFTLFGIADKTTFSGFFNAVKFCLNVLFTGDSELTRGEAAGALYSFIKTLS